MGRKEGAAVPLSGEAAPHPPKGHIPQFSAHVCCGQMAGWIKMSLGRKVGPGPGRIVLDGGSSSPSPKGAQSPNFWSMSGQTVAYLSYCRALVSTVGDSLFGIPPQLTALCRAAYDWSTASM